MSFANVSSCATTCLFIHVPASCDTTSVLNFHKFLIVHFCLLFMLLMSCLRWLCLTQGYKIYRYIFFQDFYRLSYYIWVFALSYARGRGPTSSLACGYPAGPVSFVENTISLPLNSLRTLIENQLTANVGVYFWPLNSRPSIHVSTLCQYHTVLITVAGFEIRMYESSVLVRMCPLKTICCKLGK